MRYLAGRTGWPDTIEWESVEFHARGIAELPRIPFGHEHAGNLRCASLALIKMAEARAAKKVSRKHPAKYQDLTLSVLLLLTNTFDF